MHGSENETFLTLRSITRPACGDERGSNLGAPAYLNSAAYGAVWMIQSIPVFFGHPLTYMSVWRPRSGFKGVRVGTVGRKSAH